MNQRKDIIIICAIHKAYVVIIINSIILFYIIALQRL